ncbi:MAG: metallophosphoesterase [Clostridia bacterium]|nr:metallophosphoesterase [Clostridia bacterium]
MVKFAVIGDIHYSKRGNYSTRDCLGARVRLAEIVEKLNERELDFVFSLGDLGDGHDEGELPEILEIFNCSKHPVRYAVGNHDLCKRGEREHAEAVGMPAPMYDFSVGGYRFIVLNGFEISRFSRNEAEKEAYWNFRKSNPDIPVQEWPGLLRESTWQSLSALLGAAEQNGEQVIIFCHVPTLPAACFREPWEAEPPAVLVEHDKMVRLLGKYKNVRAYIAGHYHPGGLAVFDGVVHKTVRSLCDFSVPTYVIVTVDGEKIKFSGYGAETSFIHYFDVAK